MEKHSSDCVECSEWCCLHAPVMENLRIVNTDRLYRQIDIKTKQPSAKHPGLRKPRLILFCSIVLTHTDKALLLKLAYSVWFFIVAHRCFPTDILCVVRFWCLISCKTAIIKYIYCVTTMHNNFLCPLWGDATSHVPYAHGSLQNPVFPIAHSTWTQHITIACLLRFAHERPGAARHRRQTDASWFAPCAQRQKHPVFSAAVVQHHDVYIIFIIKKWAKLRSRTIYYMCYYFLMSG